jgi:hypothetical protein
MNEENFLSPSEIHKKRTEEFPHGILSNDEATMYNTTTAVELLKGTKAWIETVKEAMEVYPEDETSKAVNLLVKGYTGALSDVLRFLEKEINIISSTDQT